MSTRRIVVEHVLSYGITRLDVPAGSSVLSVAAKHGKPVLYVLSDPDPAVPKESRTVLTLSSDYSVELPANQESQYVGTVLVNNNYESLHVFEVKAKEIARGKSAPT